MTETDRAIVAVLEDQRALLTEIRDLLACIGTPDAQAAAAADAAVCPHPEDQRIALSAMGEIHWKCRACQYEYRQRIGTVAGGTG